MDFRTAQESQRFQGDSTSSLIDIVRKDDPFLGMVSFYLYFNGDELAELTCNARASPLEITIYSFLHYTKKSTKDDLKSAIHPRTLSGYLMQEISNITQQLLRVFKRERATIKLLDGWEQQGLTLDARKFTGQEMIKLLASGASLIMQLRPGTNQNDGERLLADFEDKFYDLVEKGENNEFIIQSVDYDELEDHPTLADSLNNLAKQGEFIEMYIHFRSGVINSRTLETNPLIRREYEDIQKQKHKLEDPTGLENGYYGMWGFSKKSRDDGYRLLDVRRDSPMKVLNASMTQ